MKKYSHEKIEEKWKEKWLREKTYEPNFDAPTKPFYNLMMFPYPSGEGLHVGHAFAFSGADVYGRKKRMEGSDVFQPIGYDSFGIHSENYAIKINEHPATLTKKTTDRYEIQLKSLGIGYSWSERLLTSDPEYYRWTQWIFIQLFKAGLAYRKKQAVNWCPKCLTVLADEQVISGECERCSTVVIKKELEQWFFKITKYADRLLDGLDHIDWSEKIKVAQRNWIGKSEGAQIRFPLVNVPGQEDGKHFVDVFTTRPDTLFGATFIVISPELAKFWIDVGWQVSEDVQKYIEKTLPRSTDQETEKEKSGVFSGIYAINPANKEKVPVWVADYVLSGYGTGAIMAVPAHDERDYEFAKKYSLPVRKVIEPVFIQSTEPGKVVEGLPFDHRDAIIAIVKHWSEEKYIGLKWKKVAWGTFITGGIEQGQTAEEAAKMEIREETGFLHPKLITDFGRVHGKFYHVPKKVNRFAHAQVLYFELQDDAREAIAANEQENHDVLWLTEQEIEQFLTPDSHKWAFGMLHGSVVYTGDGILMNSGDFAGKDSQEAKWEITKEVGGERKNQYRLRDWLISRQRYWGPPIPMIWCDACAKWMPEREENLPVLLPDVKEFRPTGTDKSPLANFPEFYETKCPECKGAARRETDVSDTFLDSAWYYMRYLDPHNQKSAINDKRASSWLPVHMYIGGSEHAVLHLLYVRFLSMALHDLKLLSFSKDGEPIAHFRAHGLLIKDGAKMSKSRGNVINPDEYIKVYGADAFRMYLMFLGPFQEGGDFRDTGIRGMTRFLNRVWNYFLLAEALSDGEAGSAKEGEISASFEHILHKTIKKVSEDIEILSYNTAISALMVLLTEMEKEKNVSQKTLKIFLKLLAPFAPYITEEVYEQLGGPTAKSIHKASWPVYDPAFLEESKFVLVMQINGKVRDSVEVVAEISEAEATGLALARPKIQTFLAGAKPKKIIFIPKRLVNIVI
jgi:leucyl-tRNA synthetase